MDFFIVLGDPTLFELGLGAEVGDEGRGISTKSLIKISLIGSTAVISVNSDDSDIDTEGEEEE